MAGWHHRLNAHEFEQAPRDNEGPGSLVCWGHKESDTTEQMNNNKWKKKKEEWVSSEWSKKILCFQFCDCSFSSVREHFYIHPESSGVCIQDMSEGYRWLKVRWVWVVKGNVTTRKKSSEHGINKTNVILRNVSSFWCHLSVTGLTFKPKTLN